MQAWVDQNETFRFETACNRYISPGYRRRHVSSQSKLFSCSRRSHEHTWLPSRKVILSQGGRHQVRLGRIRHRRGQGPLGNAPDNQLTIPLELQHLIGSICGLDSYSDDSELAVRIQSRALEAFVVALKRDRKLKLLNFVTFTVETDPPRAAPTLAGRLVREMRGLNSMAWDDKYAR